MIGIDVEQFARDPHGTGIQRVLQFLALRWPRAVLAHFLMPDPDRDGVLVQLNADEAASILTIPFAPLPDRSDLREEIHRAIRESSAPRLSSAAIADVYSHWLLPEVSYLPSVLERFESARETMRTAMIGYDALPMTDPANYRFKPGSAAWVSEYFRMLAVADAVACISDYSKDVILHRLRRDAALLTTVASPGGDHVAPHEGNPPSRVRFCRVGTMEERKRPVEILEGFERAIAKGLDAELLFVGRRSLSKESINQRIEDSIDSGYPVMWIQNASDTQVAELVNHSSLFLSIGTEGYGIPVLEAIRLGTPVVYSGIQPAAELMQGRGALHLPASTEQEMSDLFCRAAEEQIALRESLDPTGIPTWQAFTDAVVQATLRS